MSASPQTQILAVLPRGRHAAPRAVVRETQRARMLEAIVDAVADKGYARVTVAEREHSWQVAPWNAGNAALESGEVLELFVIGTAVVPSGEKVDLQKPVLVLSANDAQTPARPEAPAGRA